MSWLEKIQTDLIITTGDGKSYKPNWINPTKEKQYNITEFDFPEKGGSLVDRREPKGRRYELELFFQGDDHLDQAERFEVSADDKRAWTITHPYYGQIICQPTGLYFDNTKHNVTRIVGTVIETIVDDNPKIGIDPIDHISNKKQDLDETFALSFANDVKPTTTDINVMTKNSEAIYKKGAKSIKLTFNAEGYFNAFNTANSAILKATSEPLAAIRQMQALISYPFQFEENVENRIRLLVDQFNLLRLNISNTLKRSEKKIYENNAGVLVSSIASASITNYEYGNRNQVAQVIDLIMDTYKTYLEDLDSLQTDHGGSSDSYIPDANSLNQLGSLVNFTVSNLFNIALDSKQERMIYCEDDTNIILLAHRFYGLEEDDSTIDELVNNNNIGLNELLHIRKGRKIIYYV